MRNKTKDQHSDYRQLKIKLLIRICSIMALAFLIVILFYILFWKQRGGDWIVFLMQHFLHMDEMGAIIFYQQLFRSNELFFWIIGFLAMFLILMRVVLNWLIGYFDKVNRGINAILDEDTDFDLPKEMDATKQKLKEVKAELKQRTLEAKLAEQRKNELVMYLAHDIRTPLTSVIGYLSLLDEAPDMPQEQKAKYVGITLEKAYRLEKMINEFFEITRYNLQQIHISKEPIDLYYMLVQISDELTPLVMQNGNAVEIQADENISVFADPDKLARVFNNVLKNAVTYSFPNTPIFIFAEEKDGQIIISFVNQGKTLPKEKLDDIFEKFYRLDESRSSNTGGAGLGLAIAKEIVTLHGGTITAQSKDNRITFTIILPC